MDRDADKTYRTTTNGKQRAVPRGRAQRFGKFARLAGGVAGNMLAHGTAQLAAGKRPRVKDLLLTPKNALQLTRQLAEMRGAAMKLGQILSMDTGDLLPRELANILATLRNAAYAMPDTQLQEVLTQELGPDYDVKLKNFEHRPFAAASIGQVHKLSTRQGQPAVLKVQYPGVRESIDSDVDNLAALLRVSGLLPAHMDMTPLLAEAKSQLHEEADYAHEARYLRAFVEALGDDERFLLPRVIPHLSASRVLGMTFVPGVPIEDVAYEHSEERSRVAALLFELLMIELFELRLVQTDPNFGNYLINDDGSELTLLDFGSVFELDQTVRTAICDTILAGLIHSEIRLERALVALGCLKPGAGESAKATFKAFIRNLLEPLRPPEALPPEHLNAEGLYCWGHSELVNRTGQQVARSLTNREFAIPSGDFAMVARKLTGVFTFIAVLDAEFNGHDIATPYLDEVTAGGETSG